MEERERRIGKVGFIKGRTPGVTGEPRASITCLMKRRRRTYHRNSFRDGNSEKSLEECVFNHHLTMLLRRNSLLFLCYILTLDEFLF